MIESAIKKIVQREDLSEELAYNSMNEIMNGNVSEALISAFLTGLKMKGETVDEIYSFAKVMREKAQKLDLDPKNLVDTCGTGGSPIKTFNVSTTVAFIAAASGVKVAKHGNRAVTSKSGAMDVLEKLKVKIDSTNDEVKKNVEDYGVGFMFAQLYHTAVKHVMPVRKQLGFRTVFNILGPLANPAGAKRQVLGVFDKSFVRKMAEVLKKLGSTHAMVVHGKDGLDEITLTDKTYVAELKNGIITEYELDPREYGFDFCNAEELKGSDAVENTKIINKILGGEEGSKANLAIINAGAAIYVSGLVTSIDEGIKIAKETVKSKKAYELLQKLVTN